MNRKKLISDRYLNGAFSVKFRPLKILALITAVMIATTACADKGADKQTQKESNPNFVTVKTSLGSMKIELDSEKAPLSVENFLSYAKEGYYDNTIFHRVIPQFMIQGGGFELGLSKKTTKAPILNEANNGLLNQPYTIAMARTGDPHSATSQFFINTKNNAPLNHTGENTGGWGYAVFGKVIEGQSVVDAIEKVQTAAKAGHRDVPIVDVVIESVTVGG